MKSRESNLVTPLQRARLKIVTKGRVQQGFLQSFMVSVRAFESDPNNPPLCICCSVFWPLIQRGDL